MNAKFPFVMFALIVLAALPAAADEYNAISEKLELCAGCHGKKGASNNPEYPILAGQHLYYLYVQLKDFKSGFRKNDIMSPLAGDLEKAEMLSLAKYFSEQKWPGIGFRADPAKAARGERSSPMPPSLTGGNIRRSGTSIGSVMVYRTPTTVAPVPYGEIGNQLRITLISRTRMYSCSSEQMSDAMTAPYGYQAAQSSGPSSSRRRLSSADTSTSEGVNR